MSTSISLGALLTTPRSTEDLVGLQEFLNAQRSQKCKRPEECGASEVGVLPDNGSDNEHDSTGSDNINGNIDADNAWWVGTIIKSPIGEGGRATNPRGRQGFKTDDILQRLQISPAKWGQYLVRDI